MAQEHTPSALSDITAAFQTWGHALAPAGSDRFDHIAIFSLLGYLIFAVVALHYALKPWAEKAMLASMSAATAASLLLHLSLLHTPSYVGEGPLWKFVSLTQYLPWAVISLGALYLLYRVGKRYRPAKD